MTEYRPKRRWGQNFLIDKNVVNKIGEAINPQTNDRILEIGGGKGALTDYLLYSGAEVHTVEIDRHLARHLENKFSDKNNFYLHNDDILEFDFSGIIKDQEKIRVVGNIPYNITSPLLARIFQNADKIEDVVLLVQKELAERICAESGNKTYGILTIITRLFGKAEKLFDVSRNVFRPRPNVTSSLMKITISNKYDIDRREVEKVRTVVKTGFNQRRKTLRNSLGELLPEDRDNCPIDLSRRAEKLEVEDFIRLTRWIDQKNPILT
jgi:16S rRNA (adenine1518-N6/adenine1519-N6)-dimethyltransferase